MSDVYVDNIRPRDTDNISIHGALSANQKPILPGITYADGTSQTTAPTTGGPAVAGFTSSGTWTAPAGVTRAKFTIVGAGGSGCSYGNCGSGGGGGVAIVSVTVTPSTAYTLTVGLGVSQGNQFNGSTGGSSTVVVGATTYTGAGGGGASSGNNQGSGGTGTNGDVNVTGDNGVTGEGGSSFVSKFGKGSKSATSTSSSPGFVLVEWIA
jgi:hypothetical protein